VRDGGDNEHHHDRTDDEQLVVNTLRAHRVPRPLLEAGHRAGKGDAGGDFGPVRAVRLLGSVIAPTTLLAALLYFFGQQQAHHFFNYFGVHHSLMGLTTEDYLLRSTDGVYAPLTAVATVTLLGLWAYRLLRARLSDAALRALLRVAVPTVALVGVALVGFALVAVLDPAPFRALVGLPGVSLAAGVLLLVSVSRLRAAAATQGTKPRRLVGAVAEWTATFVLVSLGLFWAVGDYSAAVGRDRAYVFMTLLPSLPNTVLYSAQGLALPPSVHRVQCSESIYKIRYDGLRLVVQSGGQLFLLPADWTPGAPAFVLPRTDALRMEFANPGSPPPDTC
jgi:hypothetical protein